MERKFLEGLGLEKETIDKVLNQNGAEVAALRTQITTKDAEIKTLRNDLVAANTRIAGLEKVDVEALQRQLDDERTGRKKDRQGWNLKAALAETGCKDPEYVMFKLGDTVEFADDGSLKDKDALIEKCKQNFASMFETESPTGTGGAGNFARNRQASTEREELEKQAADISLPLAQRVMAKEKLFNLKED